MSLFRSLNFSSISTLSTLPTTAIITNCFRHFLRIIKFRKGKKHRLNLRAGVQLRSRKVTARRCMKARQFCGQEENVFRFIACDWIPWFGGGEIFTTCEGDRVSRPECGLFSNAVFSKQTFAQSTAIKTVTTQTIFVLLTQNLAQRQRNSHRFKPCWWNC